MNAGRAECAQNRTNETAANHHNVICDELNDVGGRAVNQRGEIVEEARRSENPVNVDNVRCQMEDKVANTHKHASENTVAIEFGQSGFLLPHSDRV